MPSMPSDAVDQRLSEGTLGSDVCGDVHIPEIDEIVAVVDSLYDDGLEPIGCLMRRRLQEWHGLRLGLSQSEVKVADPAILKALCEQSKMLNVVQTTGEDEFAAKHLARKPRFVEVTSDVDDYPESFWDEVARFFQSAGAGVAFPPSCYECAKALSRSGAGFVNGCRLGDLCHIVHIAITKRKLLRYRSGKLVPVQRAVAEQLRSNEHADTTSTFAPAPRHAPHERYDAYRTSGAFPERHPPHLGGAPHLAKTERRKSASSMLATTPAALQARRRASDGWEHTGARWAPWPQPMLWSEPLPWHCFDEPADEADMWKRLCINETRSFEGVLHYGASLSDAATVVPDGSASSCEDLEFYGGRSGAQAMSSDPAMWHMLAASCPLDVMAPPPGLPRPDSQAQSCGDHSSGGSIGPLFEDVPCGTRSEELAGLWGYRAGHGRRFAGAMDMPMLASGPVAPGEFAVF
mmetsp:Transcript_122085/g.352871  ORF Transcript_122085/g.352871 Transcript_122085/m.352871 type:complete len:462 (-) Transcript_122085:116-1501(-)